MIGESILELHETNVAEALNPINIMNITRLLVHILIVLDRL